MQIVLSSTLYFDRISHNKRRSIARMYTGLNGGPGVKSTNPSEVDEPSDMDEEQASCPPVPEDEAHSQERLPEPEAQADGEANSDDETSDSEQEAEALSVASFVPAALAQFDFGQITEDAIASDEMIDFSGEENEFLTGDLKQQALAFAILTSLTGFILSAWFFLGQRAGPATELLDRRQAEGRVVKGGYRSGDRDYGGGLRHFKAPRVKPQKRQKTTRDVPEWKNLTALDKQKKKPKKKKKKKPVTIAATADTKPGYLTSKIKPRPRKKKSLTDRDSLVRLLYPRVDERPGRSSLTAVESTVRDSLISVAGNGDRYSVGLVIDSSGKALISNLAANRVDRVYSNGRPLRARLLARDAEFGCAIIQVTGGSFPDIPLAPAPPGRGEELLAFTSSRRNIDSIWCDAGSSFGKAGFFVEGYLGRRSIGSPLFNNRGELAGMHFASLNGVPGSGIHLACDSAAIYRLVRGYGGGRGYSSTESDALDQLVSLVRRGTGEAKRGRVVAGVGISDFKLGMTTDEASRWLSSPEVSRPGPGRETWRSPAPPVELLFVNDRLVAASTQFTGFSTPQGMTVGAQVDEPVLGRQFDRYKLYPHLAITPGLDIMLGGGRVTGLAVRPKVTGY